VLATTHLEDAHLVMPAMGHHVAFTRLRPATKGVPTCQVGAGTNGQHLVDRDLVANIRSNLFYLIFSPAATLYCLPPVFMTAYISALSQPLRTALFAP
jgi:hypothetical protein